MAIANNILKIKLPCHNRTVLGMSLQILNMFMKLDLLYATLLSISHATWREMISEFYMMFYGTFTIYQILFDIVNVYNRVASTKWNKN